MIVGDFDLAGASVFPAENDAPLAVDPNGPKTSPAPLKWVQVIAGWQGDLRKLRCRMNLHEAALGPLLDFAGQFARVFRSEDFCGFFA